MPADWLAKLVLVAPMGVKPSQGDILDQAIVSYIDYARAGFHDQKAFDKIYDAEPSVDQLESWDIAREMCFRIAWKPYMYSQTLPHLMRNVKIPTLLVWGDQDKIFAPAYATELQNEIPGAQVTIIPDTGHMLHVEKADAVADAVVAFASR